MNKNRRNLLSMLGISFLGSGCVPVAMNNVLLKKETPYTGPIEDSYRSLFFTGNATSSQSKMYPSFGQYDPAQSQKSLDIFNAMDKGYLPRAILMPTEDQIDSTFATFNKVKDKFAGKKELEVEETYEVMQSTIPFLRAYFDLHANNGKPANGTGSSIGVFPDGTIRVPPGYRATVIQKGYCLDAELKAPQRNDVMTLQPLSNLIPNELTPLYNSVLKGSNVADKKRRDIIQKTLWTIRSAGQPNGLASHVEPSTLQQMENAMPGGANAFVNYHNSVASSMGGKTISNNLNKISSAPTDSFAQKLFQGFLDGMNHNTGGTNNSPPIDNRNFQMAAPNVATFSIGNNELMPQIEIANASDEDFHINLSGFVMQPIKKTQRVAMAPTGLENILQKKYPIVADPAQQSLLDRLKAKVEPMMGDIGRFLNDKFLKNVSRNPMFQKLAFRLLTTSPATKAVIEAMPYLGNALSLYEAASGKNWVTGRDLNAFERIASGFGTIPGGNFIKSAFKNDIVKFGGIAFAGAGFATNQGWVPDDIAAYAKTFTNPLYAPSNLMDKQITANVLDSMVQLQNDPSLTNDQKAIVRAGVRTKYNG